MYVPRTILKIFGLVFLLVKTLCFIRTLKCSKTHEAYQAPLLQERQKIYSILYIHILVLSEVGVAKLCPYMGAFWPGFKDWYENRRTRVRDAQKTQSLGAVGSSQQEVTHLELSCHLGCFAHTLLILSEGFYPVTFNFGDFRLDPLEIKKCKNYEFLSIRVTLVWHGNLTTYHKKRKWTFPRTYMVELWVN